MLDLLDPMLDLLFKDLQGYGQLYIGAKMSPNRRRYIWVPLNYDASSFFHSTPGTFKTCLSTTPHLPSFLPSPVRI